MAFWGIEVKPGKPYTHSHDNVRGRLHISQATLAIGPSSKTSLIQCNVGDKSPVLLGALLPARSESLHLDLEFEEAEDVIFSVIGPRGVHLSGYYVGNSRRANVQDNSESYGEDIANSETEESNQCNDEDEYEGSFINDDEPELLTPSPVSSDTDYDLGEDLKEKRNVKGGHRRLRKKYRAIESDSEMSVQEIDDEDKFPISSLCKNKLSEEAGRKANKETTVETQRKRKESDVCKKAADSLVLDSIDKVDVHLIDDETKIRQDNGSPNKEITVEIDKKMKESDGVNKETTVKLGKKMKDNGSTYNKSEAVDSPVLDSINKVDVHLIDDETKGKRDKPNTSVPPSDEVVPESRSKPKKKRKEGKAKLEDANTKKINQETHIEDVANEQVGPELKAETKKKRKEHSKKGSAIETGNQHQTNAPKEKRQQAKGETDSMDRDATNTKDDPSPNDLGLDLSLEAFPSGEVGPEKNSKMKKKRKERSEAYADGADNFLLAGNREEEKLSVDKTSDVGSNQLAGGNHSEEKKRKKKKRKMNETQEIEENMNKEVKEHDKFSAMEPEGKNVDFGSSRKRTLSNGLIIEDLVTGNSKGKVAASGRKVKVQYVVKLKENGNIIDSNTGKSPYKFRLGDKKVIEGLNIGLDGMRVGDKRRLVIPPSMSSGYKGTSENIPPNSWLVYDVEVVGVH